MQQNRDRTEVTHMEPDEIRLYELYAAEGVTRGRLPHSPTFYRIVANFNAQTGENRQADAMWVFLESVLKNGEAKIEAYLRRIRAGAAAAPAAVAV